jgi:hypothetical protein
MKTLDYSNTIFFDEKLENIVERKTLCINNATALIKHNKKLTFIHYITKVNDYYVLIFKIVKKDSCTIKEYNKIKEQVTEHFWSEFIDRNFTSWL